MGGKRGHRRAERDRRGRSDGGHRGGAWFVTLEVLSMQGPAKEGRVGLYREDTKLLDAFLSIE